MKTTGLAIVYIVSFYMAYKIFQPEIKQIITRLKIPKKASFQKIKKEQYKQKDIRLSNK